MNEIKELLKQLKEKVSQELWKEATELAKQINTLVEPNLKREKYQWIYNCTKSFSDSYPQMKSYQPPNAEKRERFRSMYNNFHGLHLQNVIRLIEFVGGKGSEEPQADSLSGTQSLSIDKP